ncbi:MAG: group 1 glycosyl transferase [Candidatus Syntrophoarchaeum butanivorans]|uniref:Group 1 glycosyl transferase n=1 Tax=Candidatus Syntropharchaeum butanivorans TaxID=1839936 RepID=A0A1F2P6W1_9EURY|nr:MAG: group 1 glycosyl transferase [Candidatus Syntrophoarchaeum butanivorans]
MKIIHWNISKKSHPMYALRKYEDELFHHMKELKHEWDIERIRRKEGKILGSTVFFWLFYKGKRADIVHATSQTVAPAIFFRRPKRFIVTVHDMAPLVYPSEIRDLSMKIQFQLTPKALKKADRIIAISEFTKRELIRLVGIEEEKISVVYQGVDHDKYKPMDKTICKKRFGLNPEKKHILVVSSNLEHKRMDIARKVFNTVREVRENIEMIKAGYGELLEGDDIVSMGWITEDEMPALFNAADVYLHTSEYEGFGLPILEAMACGTPVVVSDQASIPEVVGDYGNMVDLSADTCVDEFVEKILKNIDKGEDKNAIEQSKKFSWEKTARETINVYSELA